MASPTTIRITPVTLTELTIIVESTNGIEVKTLADCTVTAKAITLSLATGSYNLRFYSQGYNVGILENASGLGGNQIELTPTSDYIKTSDGTNDYYVKDNYSRQFGSDLLDIVMTKAAKSVVDQRDSSSLKYWTGTKAQYDAIVAKDSNTIYNVEDATSTIADILNTLYPIGAIYIGTMATCPLSVLGIGTWQLVAQDRVLQGAGTRGTVGTTINESLPNIKGTLMQDGIAGSGTTAGVVWGSSGVFGAITSSGNSRAKYSFDTTGAVKDTIPFNASNSSSTYQDNAPVQQDGYLVNIWERTA